jgi:hypothetical protein
MVHLNGNRSNGRDDLKRGEFISLFGGAIARGSDRATFAGLVAVCLVALAVLGPHVFAGGFHEDDWVDASHYYLHPGHGFWAAVANSTDPNREAYALLRTANYAIFGMQPAYHLALTALVAMAEASLLLLLMRRLGVAAAPATVMALLLLALPDADSTRLWANGVQMELFAGLLPLAGLLVALRGLEQPGWRGAALHGVALALYAVSVNGYELGAPMILLFGFLYTRRNPGRAACWRWSADVLVVLGVLISYAIRRDVPPLDGVPYHLKKIAADGLGVIARAFFPVPEVPPAVVLLPALVIVVAAAAGAFSRRFDTQTRVELRRALLLLAGGVAVTAAGWAMIIPANFDYTPGGTGINNRINAVAAIGLAMAVIAITGLVAIALRASLRGRVSSLALLTTLLAMPIAIADVVRLEWDAANWNHAAEVGRTFLVRLRELVPKPPPGTTLFTFGVSGQSNPGVVIFSGAGSNDLLGAVRVTYGTPAISGFPVFASMQFSCGPTSMTLLDTGESSTTQYGLAMLIDMRGAGRVLIPKSESDCLQATAQLAPYPPDFESIP